MGAALVVLGLIVISGMYFLLTGFGTGGSPATASPVTGTGNPLGDSQNGSYVIVENEEPLPVATTPVSTNAVPSTLTTSPTTYQTTKPVVCAADRMKCDNRCVDVRYSSSHCGYCNNTCPEGQSCMNGHCQIACSLGETSCIDGCYDTLTDPDHCGSCLNNCPAGLLCRYGQCTAPATPIAITV
ncbi:MAG: hypothetical protein M0R30_10220 [Methanoregula sp.]|uniref:hypothetical protein n=1 Tax=Methanoregula sp. TaxID=2052170 RepID=UPI0025F8C57C|nr:hypothetical protein [Methanoregula sp.]MCK9632006.1 hypothetical protein [Methanoregula sp.]